MGDFTQTPFMPGTMGMGTGGTAAMGLAAGAIPYAIDWVTKHLVKRGEQEAARQVDKLMGINGRVGKFRRHRHGRLPRIRKGYERIAGFYGRFKPTFGKELKFRDTAFNSIPIRDSWNIRDFISLVDKGTGPKQRIGRSYTIRSLQFRFHITKISTFSRAVVRMLIIWDKQTNGESFTGDQLIVDGLLSTNRTYSQYRNLENISRFEILWDKTWVLNATTRTTGGTPASNSISDSYYKKIAMRVEMKDTSGAATVTDVNDNSIVVMLCGDQSDNSALTLTGTFRIRFTG